MLYKLKQFGKTNLHDAVKAQLHEMLESDLYARFFQNSDIHELSMEVTECGKMFSIFFVFNLDNLDDDYDFLKDISFNSF